MGKGSFIIYDKDLKGLDLLTEYQAGKLFKALGKYRLEGKNTSFGNNVAIAILFQQMIDHIEINEERYQLICEKRSEAVKKRWDKQKNNTNEYKSIEMNTNGYLYDNENENDNVNENDNDNVNVPYGAGRENKRKNYYQKKNNVPLLLRDEPAYDTEAFMRKSLNLKYHKKESQPEEINKDDQRPSL